MARGRSPDYSPQRSRSLSRSRSPMRSVSPRRYSRSPRRSLSRSPVRRSRSRSITPRRSPPDYKARLERLYDTGKCKESDLELSTLDALDELSAELADCATQRFAEANFDKVINRNGFFMGIIRRIGNEGADTLKSLDLDSLIRPVRTKIQDLIDARRLRADDVEQRMIKALYDLPGDLAVQAVDRFCLANLDAIRSKTGFMIGIIRRIEQDRDAGVSGRGGYGREREWSRDRDYRSEPRDYGRSRGREYGRERSPYDRDRGYGREREYGRRDRRDRYDRY